MDKVKDYILLHICVLVFSFTGVFTKFAANALNAGGFRNPQLYIFVFLMLFDCLVYAFFWQKVIKNINLNVGYANKSVYLVWAQLWAYLIFGEHISFRCIIGMIVIVIGVIVVSMNADYEEEQ
ncbi:MAG: EamA family transporter [Mogibacterium sp.]|nr:EamA family transporter [Mogibacterium sp.]